jgi:hypothetical protein
MFVRNVVSFDKQGVLADIVKFQIRDMMFYM